MILTVTRFPKLSNFYLSLFLLFLLNPAFAQTYESVLWSNVAPQPFTVNEAQGRVVNGKLYTFGGFDVTKSPNFTPTKRSYVFDPVANTWSAIADLPFTPNGSNFGGITHTGIATDGTDIFFAGGYISNAAGTGQVFGTSQAWRYHVATNTYTPLPDLPYATSAAQMEFLDGKLHLVGGTNPARTNNLGDHLVLDLANPAAGWTTLASLPNPRHHGGSAVVNGKIYFIGGQHGHDGQLITQNDVHVYDPSTNAWTQLADLPSPAGTNGRGHISSATIVVDNKILVIAGETSHGVTTNMVSLYDPATDTWENLTPLPAGRYSGVAAFMRGRFYYTGGSSTGVTYSGVPIKPGSLKVNFQDNAATTPAGWLKDYGQAYGARTSPSQGTGNVYGWLRKSDHSPLDLTLNGRNRNTPADVLLATLMHMQANHIANFTGTKEEGAWEADVPNGQYDVTVSVGDGSQTDSRHSINVEGVAAITDFVPTTSGRFKIATVSVAVNDGKLTIDATGGQNSKINYLVAYRTAASNLPSLSFSDSTLSFEVIENGNASSRSSLLTASSGNPSVTLSKSANSNWLVLPTNPGAGSLSFSIDATNLAPGNYSAVVTASAPGFTSDMLQVNLSVLSNPAIQKIALSPIADAYTRKSTLTTNYGNADTLVIKSTPSTSLNRNSFFKFSLSEISRVSSAKLRVYGRNLENARPITVSALAVDVDNWTETGITWSNQPPSFGEALSTAAVDNIGKYYEFDVTHFVRAELAGDRVVTIMLTDSAVQEKLISFNSRENSANKPELLIFNDTTTYSLSFSTTNLHFAVSQNDSTGTQQVFLSASAGMPDVTLGKAANSSWLVLPTNQATGSLTFGVAANGLVPGLYTSYVIASAPGYSSDTLQVQLRVNAVSGRPGILFTQAARFADVGQGATLQMLDYVAVSDSSIVSVKLDAVGEDGSVPNWIFVNGNLLNGINYTAGSEITFLFDATNLSIGEHSARITASHSGYDSAVLNITLDVKAGSTGVLADIMVNFQDAATMPPAGWVRDFGQAFGTRTSAHQGTGNLYGWLRRDNKAPLDLTLNGRRRNTPGNVLLATFMHMQGNDIPTFSGTKVEGIWEMQVANGAYDVTVSAGDGTAVDSRHSINIEGIPAIINFIPSAAAMFKTATISVSVSDGLLTLDAIGGKNTKINYIMIKPTVSRRPSVVSVSPENGSMNVSENTSVSTLILNLPNGGIDNNTITTNSVYLTEQGNDSVFIPVHVNGTGGGDAITLAPTSPLKLSTTYVFHITDKVKDLTGSSFIPYTSSFTTGAVSTSEIINAKFTRVALPNTTGRHSTLTMGPDGKLYALSIDGLIKRFVVNPDGTLQDPELIYSLQDAYGSRTERLATGFAFSPHSTANNFEVYITHSSFVFIDGPDWDGKLTRLTGPNLENVQDILINLPRSAKDHLTNSIAFGPDGKLYLAQGSNSAMGRADLTWGNRDEHLLNGAVLKLDLQKLTTVPLDVKTDDGGNYDPYAPGAPLTIYASGVRNAYDLVWHSNGELYVPTNGSAAGGNTPASVAGASRPDGNLYSGPVVPAISNVQQTQKDFLYRVEEGGYYGHPNPTRGEFVMNGGNPTAAIDPAQVDQYPVGTMPDANYRGYAFDFQMNKSPNGIIEYRSASFNGALTGKLMVVRYSQHDDIITLTTGGANKEIISYNEGVSIQGFTGFNDPLDLTEDINTGNIYVSEYGGDGQITLLTPQVPPVPQRGVIDMFPDTLIYNQTIGGGVSLPRTIWIKNIGAGALVIDSITMAGTNAAEFVLVNMPGLPSVINGGDSLRIDVAFDPNTIGIRTATINIHSNDSLHNPSVATLRGLGTAGLGGSNEPSLQAIFNLYQLPINTGDDNTSTTVIHSNSSTQRLSPLGDEVIIPRFVKADSGNVIIEPLAIFGPTASDTIVAVGWYMSGNAGMIHQLYFVSNNPLSNGQTVNVAFSGTTGFDPGDGAFGFYSRWPLFANRHIYSEDSLNTFAGSVPHNVRVYPYKNVSGVLIPNTYVVTFEDHITAFDYNDVVFIVRNVKSAGLFQVAQEPVADAYTRNGAAVAQNFGMDTVIAIKAHGSAAAGVTRNAYLKFTLGQVSEIRSAKLRLYGNSDNAANATLSVFGVTNDNWEETNVTYTNGPVASGSVLGTFNVNSTKNFYEIDVTAFVKMQFEGDKVASFMIRDVSNQNKLVSLNSRENNLHRPQLVITTSSTVPASHAVLTLENLDRFPSNDLYNASHIYVPWTRDTIEPKIFNKNHDTVKIRMHNRGSNNLVIKNLIRSNNRNWTIYSLKGVAYDSATAFPHIIAPGAFSDLWIRFDEITDLNTRVKQFSDQLTIHSNDDRNPVKIVALNGMWQREAEGSREPRTQEMISFFGFKSNVGFTASDPDSGDAKIPKGDEVISTYFVRADVNKPVYVIQMSAYHGCCTQAESLRWYEKTSGTPTFNTIFTHIGLDGQTMLPRKGNSSQTPADGSFNPNTPFGFRVGSNDHSDTLRNPGRKIGIRVWKVRDANGRIVPNEYIMANDYLGTSFTNYDYNDNLYYVKNIRPELGTPNFSALGAAPQAIDFNDQTVGTTTQLSVGLMNNGIASYPDGTSDPAISISSIQVVGPDRSEFSLTMPAVTSLNAQQATTMNVSFNPASQGVKNADLLVNYNFGKPLRIPLHGIGKNAGMHVTLNNRIKAGSTSAVTINGKSWSAETGFVVNQNLEPFGNAQVTAISCTDDDSLYLRVQSANGDRRTISYQVNLPNGDYVVRLHFAEILWANAGSRIMSVLVENQIRLLNLDVAAEAGPASALVRNIPVTVVDGQLNISLTASTHRPMLAGIEIFSFSASAGATYNASIALTRTEIPGKTAKPMVWPNPLKNRFNLNIPAMYHGKLNLSLTDVTGRKFPLGTYSLGNSGTSVAVNISRFAFRPGVYFLTMDFSADKRETIKLMIK